MWKKILGSYYVFTALWLMIGVLIVIADCIHVAVTGEFRFLTGLNMIFYKMEEATTVDYFWRFYGDTNTFPHLLLSSTVTLALFNAVLYDGLKWRGMQMSPYITVCVWTSFIVAVILIALLRLFTDNTWAVGTMKAIFPIAYVFFPKY